MNFITGRASVRFLRASRVQNNVRNEATTHFIFFSLKQLSLCSVRSRSPSRRRSTRCRRDELRSERRERRGTNAPDIASFLVGCADGQRISYLVFFSFFSEIDFLAKIRDSIYSCFICIYNIYVYVYICISQCIFLAKNRSEFPCV